MFFPSENAHSSLFYADKDCEMKEAYQLYQNGDHAGAVRMMDSGLQQCKAGNAREKSLARAYYDAGLLHCASQDYETANPFFTSAMQMKGAEAIAATSAACEQARAGAIAVNAYRARWAQIPVPQAINTSPSVAEAKQPAPQQAGAAQPSPSGQASPTQSAKASVAQRLKELEDLYKKGLISKKGYEQKRAEILKSF